jgi:hypothetical protein
VFQDKDRDIDISVFPGEDNIWDIYHNCGLPLTGYPLTTRKMVEDELIMFGVPLHTGWIPRMQQTSEIERCSECGFFDANALLIRGYCKTCWKKQLQSR